MEDIDQQIKQWYQDISPELQLDPANLEQELQSGMRGTRRLKVLVYMRLNSVRLSLYRPILHSATSIMQNRDLAQRAVDIAKDTITILTRVNRVSDLYRTQQVRFNHFLISALAALFLAVCHAPAEFNRDVREEFYMALDIIKGFSASSRTSRKLWATIRQLRSLFQRLDAFKSTGMDDPHSNAALAMAGLAGQPVDTLAYGNFNNSSLGSSPQDGMQMSNELTYLFEMAGASDSGYASGSVEPSAANGELANQYPSGLTRQAESGPAGGVQSARVTDDAEFLKILGQIF